MTERVLLVGDVINSQQIPDRTAFKRALDTGLDALNTKLDADGADVRLVKGVDEIAGVVPTVRAALVAQKHLVEAAHPEGIRIVVVRGEIDVGIDAASVADMDGPGFARADALIEQVTRDEQFFALEAGDATLDSLIGDLVNLLTMHKLEWSERQLEVTQYYEELGSQRAVAAELDITVQSVSQTLRRAWAKQLLPIEARVHQVATTYDAQPTTPDPTDP